MLKVNTILIADDPLLRQLVTESLPFLFGFHLIGVFDNGIEAKNSIDFQEVNLILLDERHINRESIDYLQNCIKPPWLIILADNPDFNLERSANSILDVVLKPFHKKRLEQALKKAKDKLDEEFFQVFANEHAVFKDGNRTVLMLAADIIYIKALGDYVQIYFEDTALTILSSMKDMETRLSDKQFMRIHRSFIVNIAEIETVHRSTIKLKDGTELAIGRKYKSLLYNEISLLN